MTKIAGLLKDEDLRMFVIFAIHYRPPKMTWEMDENLQTLIISVLRAVGFPPHSTRKITSGPTSVVVLTDNNDVNKFATAWIEYVAKGINSRKKDSGSKLELNKGFDGGIIQFLDGILPFPLIQLTEIGDRMVVVPHNYYRGLLPIFDGSSSIDYYNKKIGEDGESLVHLHCGGELSLQRISLSHGVVICNSCTLRAPFRAKNAGVMTYLDLENALDLFYNKWSNPRLD